MLEKLRFDLYESHLEIFRNNLVVGTSGNISVRDAHTNLVVIKPSGVGYSSLTPESMVVLSISGDVVEGNLRPSVDTATHLYIYQHRPDVYGIVHTHSCYATAFATVGMSIPPVLTSIADEFGGPIPCSEYAQVGGDAIGREVLRSIGTSRALLLRQHGVFTIGSSLRDAVSMAIKTEEMAKTVYFANQLGPLKELPLEEVSRAHQCYAEQYGQMFD